MNEIKIMYLTDSEESHWMVDVIENGQRIGIYYAFDLEEALDTAKVFAQEFNHAPCHETHDDDQCHLIA